LILANQHTVQARAGKNWRFLSKNKIWLADKPITKGLGKNFNGLIFAMIRIESRGNIISIKVAKFTQQVGSCPTI